MVLVFLFLTSLRVITSGSVKLYNMSIPPTCHERAHTCLDTHIEAQHSGRVPLLQPAQLLSGDDFMLTTS